MFKLGILGNISVKSSSENFQFLPERQPLFEIQPTVAASAFIPNDLSFNIPKSCVEAPAENWRQIFIEDNLPKVITEKLMKIHKFHEKVFNGDLSQGYNGFSGNFDVDFNFLNDIPPPIHYGCVPSYNKKEDDILLQTMIDKLESMNVVAKANAINVIPKFASPCMLVKKSSARSLKPGVYESLPIEE